MRAKGVRSARQPDGRGVGDGPADRSAESNLDQLLAHASDFALHFVSRTPRINQREAVLIFRRQHQKTLPHSIVKIFLFAFETVRSPGRPLSALLRPLEPGL